MGIRQRTVTIILLAGAGTCMSIGIGRPHDVCVDPGRSHLVPVHVAPPLPGAGCELPGPVCPCEPVTIPLPADPPVPVVSVRVRVPSCAQVGGEVEYRILVENSSPAAAHRVLVRNALPSNAHFVRATPAPARHTPELQWDLGTLPRGACCEIVLVLKAQKGADLTNCTRVQFEHGQCVTTHLVGSAPLAPKGPTKEPPAIPGGKARLTLEMTGPEQQYINIPAQYFIIVKNTGTAPATKVLIADKLPDGTSFVRADHNGKFAEGQVAWFLGTLEAGASKTVELVLRAKSAGKMCNKASVEADGGLKATAEMCTIFKGASALLLDMVDRQDPIPVGGNTSYPITIVNQGQMAVTNTALKAFVPDMMAFLRADGPTKYRFGEKTATHQVLLFEPLARLEPQAKITFEVYVSAHRPGDARFMVELSADQLKAGGPVRQQESTTIFPENDRPPRRQGLETRLRRLP